MSHTNAPHQQELINKLGSHDYCAVSN